MTVDDQLAEVLRMAAEPRHVPGAAVGVLIGDVVHTATYGVTNIEHPQPVSSASLFQVGSITKTFTSAAVMLLVEEGRLHLSDPISQHLPALGAATGLDLDAITVELALSHQAGFDGDHLFVARETDDLAALADARRLFAPGTGYSYCNAGFSLVGDVIEAVTGQPFERFVRDRLLAPLGMASATFRADRAITHSVAAPHWVADDRAFVIRGGGWQPGWELGRIDRPAGGLIASVDHLLEWCRFQGTGATPDGTVLLHPASLARLHTPVVAEDLLEQVALDWFVHDVDGVRSIGHTGSTAGYISDLFIVPERQFAFVGLTNATNGSAVNGAVRRWALERFADIREQDPLPDPSLVVDVNRFLGDYVHSFARLVVRAGAEPATIVITPEDRDDTHGWQPPLGPAVTCGFFAPDHAVTIDGDGRPRLVRFGFDDTDGTGETGETGGDRASWVLWDSRRAPRIA